LLPLDRDLHPYRRRLTAFPDAVHAAATAFVRSCNHQGHEIRSLLGRARARTTATEFPQESFNAASNLIARPRNRETGVYGKELGTKCRATLLYCSIFDCRCFIERKINMSFGTRDKFTANHKLEQEHPERTKLRQASYNPNPNLTICL